MGGLPSPVVQEILELNKAILNGKNYRAHLHWNKLAVVSTLMLDFAEKPKDFEFEITEVGLKQIFLVSGGMDSTIGWYARNKPIGLYLDVGQPYVKKELNALISLGVDYTHIDFGNLTPPKDSEWKHIIPGRNLLFLTAAAELVSFGGTVHLGVMEGEGSGDRSIPFVRAFEDWYNSVTGKRITVQTMIEKTKPEWLEWFIKAGHDPNIIRYDTVSCYASTKKPCGKCLSCLKKYMAFVNNGIDIAEDYEVHPMVGAQDHVANYIKVLYQARRDGDFSHYSAKRIRQDLEAIEVSTDWMVKKALKK